MPPDDTQIHSSLGEAQPRNIVVFPALFEGQTKAVIELASLRAFPPTHLAFLEQLTQSIGVVLNTIEATMRTEGLLKQSQQLTAELQTQQKDLEQTNEELATNGRQLAEQSAPDQGTTIYFSLPKSPVEPKSTSSKPLAETIRTARL